MKGKGPPFKDLIRYNYVLMLRCMDPSDEFLSNLASVVYLTNRLSAISQHVTVDDRANALLTVLLQIPDELQESVMNSFVAALRNSGQDHVANIFRGESDKVPMSLEHHEILTKHIYQFCQFLDPENGLLDKLVSAGVISSADYRRIRSKTRLDIMARELIDTICRKSDETFDVWIQALNETGQSHVAFIITGQGNSRPLSEALSAKLISQRQFLINTMEAKNSGLVSALVTNGVYSQYDEQRVTGKYNEIDVIVNETILDLIMRKSQSSFDSFIKALKDTGQGHVAAVLQTDVAAATSASGKLRVFLKASSHLIIDADISLLNCYR